ncbi:HTH_Tnp_Tc3_2 domain-containing protein [Trichonephila clavipes]|nr:HTH_Tnp_Tc3_2 domain-containing protein [Trichonephila clavipes]
MAVNDHTASFRQLAARSSTVTGVLMSDSSIRRRLLLRGFCAKVRLCRILSRQIIVGCVCNGLMSTEPSDKLISTKMSFQMNHALHLWDHDGRIRVRRYLMFRTPRLQSALSNDRLA